ncbi:MAG: hypothetical protein ACI8X5_002490 [Planctomycetota bacterium]|jgi:hypothetical protein
MTRILRLCLIALLFVGSSSFGRAQVLRKERLVLENKSMRIDFDLLDGRIRAVRNKTSQLDLLPSARNGASPPRISLFNRRSPKVLDFSFEVLEESAEKQTLRMTWKFSDKIELEVRAELAWDSELAYLWLNVKNDGPAKLNSLFFPNFNRLETLGEVADDDYLVHGFVRGMKIRNPKKSLDMPHNPLGETSYPQAYNGMTHQLVDYYSEGRGGFFFAAFDPHSTEKSVEMPVKNGELVMNWRYRNWDERPGQAIELDFPFVIGVNTTGDWYRAADYYREWAITTDWCTSDGPNATKPAGKRADWLYEDIGLATFGMSTHVDQSAWYEAYHNVIDAPVFHVTGLDWIMNQGRDDNPLDLEVGFHPANLAAFERNGDYAAIFLADLKTSFLPNVMAYEVGRLTISVVPRATPEACPETALWRFIHGRRAAQALELTGVDSFYMDASAPNRGLLCESRVHGHPPGRGRWMNTSFRELYAQTAAGLTDACGAYTPLGVELMHEGLIDTFDYYQARNGAGFMGGLEGGFFRGLQLRGLAETVPVFSYIYHDYAPVVLDGCGKISERIGDIFYWMAARVVLAGGIFEVNNEFAPTERFLGMTDVGILHYLENGKFEKVPMDNPANSPYDERKGEFVRDIAAARTSFAMDFLAYGQMLPPLPMLCDEIKLDYHYYNNIDWGGKHNSTEFADKAGSYRTPEVLSSAWKFEDRLGLLFVNLSAEPQSTTMLFDMASYGRYGLEFGSEVQGKMVTSDGQAPLVVRDGERREVLLPARQVVLFEFSAR